MRQTDGDERRPRETKAAGRTEDGEVINFI